VPTAYLSPSQLKELTDVSVNPGAPQDGYPLVWNNTNGKWEASFNIAGVTIRAGLGAASQALGSTANSSGIGWIAQGSGAAQKNINGDVFVAQGADAALENLQGGYFIAQGVNAAKNNLGGYFIAQGVNAAFNNSLGGYFIAQGVNAGAGNTAGSFWTAQGAGAGEQSGAAGYFIALGYESGYFDTRSNVLNIANSRSKSLICGNFANDCIYFGHVGPIISSANVPVPTAAVHAAASNTTRASLRIDSGVAPTTPNTGDIWMNVSDNSLTLNFPLVRIGSARVLADNPANWGAPTGTASKATFNTATVTVEELAKRVKALIDLIGAT